MSGNGAGIGLETILRRLRRIPEGLQVIFTVCFVVAAGAAAIAFVGWLFAASSTLAAASAIWASVFREQSGNLLTFLPYYLLEKKGT